MELIKANLGNIIVGFIVFAALGFTVFRLIKNSRQGKGGCGCGGCSRCG
ncbi:MAG: FeoB-associated Cys-rich membrane protein [Treponema sp.]|nr:FeoB-associated Cys-rich membrane protein [Treponema sp.]